MLYKNSKYINGLGWVAPLSSARGKYLYHLGEFPTYTGSEKVNVYFSDLEEEPVEFYYSDVEADCITVGGGDYDKKSLYL